MFDERYCCVCGRSNRIIQRGWDPLSSQSDRKPRHCRASRDSKLAGKGGWVLLIDSASKPVVEVIAMKMRTSTLRGAGRSATGRRRTVLRRLVNGFIDHKLRSSELFLMQLSCRVERRILRKGLRQLLWKNP